MRQLVALMSGEASTRKSSTALRPLTVMLQCWSICRCSRSGRPCGCHWISVFKLERRPCGRILPDLPTRYKDTTDTAEHLPVPAGCAGQQLFVRAHPVSGVDHLDSVGGPSVAVRPVACQLTDQAQGYESKDLL